jgi:hypothetical protein
MALPESARCLITDSSIWPAAGFAQSSGAVTVVHSKGSHADQASAWS